jgi:hypothetical protein
MHDQRHLLAALACAGLACLPPLLPPDRDAVPGNAMPLAFSIPWTDSLECGRGDCADWFRLEVPAVGDLLVAIALADAGPDAAAVRATLIDPVGVPLMRVGPKSSEGSPQEIRHRARTKPGTYLLAVFSGKTARRLGYQLRIDFDAALPPARAKPGVSQPGVSRPAPAPPSLARFETKRTVVLEVEGPRSASPMVLLGAGEADRMKRGLRGRLIEKGLPIAEIVIVDVYPEGSRARIEKRLGGEITVRTIAEIEVPLEPAKPQRLRTPAPARRQD